MLVLAMQFSRSEATSSRPAAWCLRRKDAGTNERAGSALQDSRDRSLKAEERTVAHSGSHDQEVFDAYD